MRERYKGLMFNGHRHGCQCEDCCTKRYWAQIKEQAHKIKDLTKQLAERDAFLKEHCPCDCDCCEYADGVNVKFPNSSSDACLLCMASGDMGNWKFKED